MPAKAGTQKSAEKTLDASLRWHDNGEDAKRSSLLMTIESKLPNLEDALTEISALIEKMEQGELTLENSLDHFERGITLVKHCQKILEAAEQKVQILIQNNNQEELSVYKEDKNLDAKENDL